ncbi:MAG: TRAP transporter small permease subunit, partial [Acetobacteraceae bacterium]
MWVIVAICGINVARRYLFGSVWSWAEEAMLFLMIIIVFLGAATVTWNGMHLALDMLLN